jgi:3-hydroxy-9,10-secoandrosta-1,3,5(10)-triene-9,17-dione monooxygenase
MTAADRIPAKDDAEKLIARAANLVHLLRSRSADDGAIGKLSETTVQELNNAALFELTIPSRYGGLQTSIRTYKDIVVQLARGDASAAWTVSLINIGNWLAATLYAPPFADELLATPGGLRACSVLSSRDARVRKVHGGWIIEEGIWRFNSGVYHANWDLLGIPLVDEAGNVIDQGLAAIPIEQVNIFDDWDAIGLSATGSSSVAVRNVFVPTERIASISAAIDGRYRSNRSCGDTLYRAAFIPFLAIVLAFPLLGAGQAALETFLKMVPNRSIKYTWYENQAEAPVTHLQVSEASARIDAAESIVDRAVDDLDRDAETGGESMDILHRARIRRDTGFSSQLICEAVDLLVSASGGSFALASNPMNRLWRDTRIASLHGAVCVSTNLELYGRLLCGQKANTRLV